MTIDEAIKHARVSSERLTRLGNAEKALEQPCYKVTLEQAKEHEQLAEWLEDYKRLKSEKEQDIYERAYRDGQDKGLSDGHFAGYNKAIDDFTETIKTSQEAHLWYCSDYGLEFCNGDNCEECSHEFTKQIDKIAEKLKKVE